MSLQHGPFQYRPQSSDTSERVDRMQVERWRSLSIVERARLVGELCRSVHELSLAGLRSRHPEASLTELEERAARIRIGSALYDKARAARAARR